MQNVLVGEPLDVADVEYHVQGEAHAGVFEDLEGFELAGGEGGDFAGFGEAGEGFYEVWVPSLRLLAGSGVCGGGVGGLT